MNEEIFEHGVIFVTFTCCHRRPGFDSPAVYDLFLQVLEEMRRRFQMCIYGYVVMPEHVHLLLSELKSHTVEPTSKVRIARL